jgi:hypothetical protein
MRSSRPVAAQASPKRVRAGQQGATHSSEWVSFAARAGHPGNQALLSLLHGPAPDSRRSSPPEEAATTRVQALEGEADRAATNVLRRMERAPARPRSARATEAGATRLDATLRTPYELALGEEFSDVRIHDDGAAHRTAEGRQARALTQGNHIVFSSGAFRPDTDAGRRLLAHELAHVVQQRHGAAGRNAIQHQDDVTALRARLQAVRARLQALRAATRSSSDTFARDRLALREQQIHDQDVDRVRSQVIEARGARGTFPHSGVAAVVRRVASAQVSGQVVTVRVPIQLRYLALPDDQARQRAATDLPRVADAIRNVWQVNIESGEYAGYRFRVEPTVTFLANGDARATNAFLIEVRGEDADPSAGDGTTGTISLAAAHLQGNRVRVVAHELAHLFGFIDAYLLISRDAAGTELTGAVVGRRENPAQADLLGMIDPFVIARWLRLGIISQAEANRQLEPVTVWEDEASQVLRILGVLPPSARARPRPSIDSEDFDPAVELDEVRRSGEERLAGIRQRRRSAEESIQWLNQVEEIMRLEAEERALIQRIGDATRRR